MKYKYIIGVSILLFCFVSSISAQNVGINTLNPRTTLHIDGASTPQTTNPSTGDPSATQAGDDFTINNLGNLGIGVQNAQTKLEIKSLTPGGIIINDGSQDEGKALISSTDDGDAIWGNISGSWFAILRNATLLNIAAATERKYINFASSYQSNPLLGAADQTDGSIKVPYNGIYRIIISGEMSAYRSATPTDYVGRFNIYVNGVKTSLFAVFGNSTFETLNFSGAAAIYLNKNDVITAFTDETSGTSSSSETRKVVLQVIYIGNITM